MQLRREADLDVPDTLPLAVEAQLVRCALKGLRVLEDSSRILEPSEVLL
jgi:hypothetical protein